MTLLYRITLYIYMFRAVFMYVVFQIIRIPLFGLKKEKKEVPLLCVVYCQLYNRRAECSYSFCVYGGNSTFLFAAVRLPPIALFFSYIFYRRVVFFFCAHRSIRKMFFLFSSFERASNGLSASSPQCAVSIFHFSHC